MKTFSPLPATFYTKDTLAVAKNLLGKILVHQEGPQTTAARIVETEAYTQDDPACHAYSNHVRLLAGKPIRGRSEILFGQPGVAYVYFNYGMYWLFNVVTESEGCAGAVLVRAVEPVLGIEVMRLRRPAVKKDPQLTNGPGKLTIAMGIGPTHNGVDLTQGDLFIANAPERTRRYISTSPRIGISKATDRMWRFYLTNNPYVSKTK